MARYDQSYAGERRSAGLRVQLTPTERQQIQAEAAECGARLSEHVRELCLHRAQPVVAGTRRNPEAKALLFELQALGNNLNQLARHANTANMLVQLRDLDDLISLLKAAITRVIGL